MAFDNTVTIVGNAVNAPELRFAASGTAVVSFGLAWNRRSKDGEDETSFFDVTCFGSLAENVAESVVKGTRVVVFGALQQRSWETKDGDRRSKVEIIADDVGPSLRWAAAKIERNARDNKPGGRGAVASYDPDEEPF